MIEIAAVVTAVENGYLEVESASTGCGRCHEPGGCGGVSLGSMLCAKPRRLRVRNDLPGPVQVGDQVDVGVADGILGQAALVTYCGEGIGMAQQKRGHENREKPGPWGIQRDCAKKLAVIGLAKK